MNKNQTLILSLIFYIFLHHLYAQNEFMHHWHFGNGASLDFSSGTPVATAGSAMKAFEGCVSYSNNQGELLFYTNGGETNGYPGLIWNKNHEVMPNGHIGGFIGSTDATQSSLVIPRSGTEYYLFTLDTGIPTDYGFNYSIIDMALDGGLGDLSVVGTNLISGQNHNLKESFSATKHANGTDYWLSVVGEGDTMYMFQVTPTNILGPTVQNIEISTQNGQLKFNIQGDKLVYGNTFYDFDYSTGTLSNPTNLMTNAYGAAFSRSGRFLYASSLFELSQFDLYANDIPNSRVDLFEGQPFLTLSQLQIGPDFKIYLNGTMDDDGFGYISVINNPDQPGLACNLVENQIQLSIDDLPNIGYPHFIESNMNPNLSIKEQTSETSCQTQLHPNPARNTITIPNAFNGDFIKITSSEGKELPTWKITDNQLDIQPLSSGIYYLQINNSTCMFVKN